jgi:uncharacterized protein (TIGR02996 family)
MRTFVFTDGKSNKFWNIELQGTRFTVTFGKVGAAGQTQTKDFPDEEKAEKAHDKLIAEKLDKGYVETTPTPAQATPTPLLQAIEQGLVEDPDDLAAHAARADYLMEQGDPRGEFIQAQLALEDPRLDPGERTRLQERADDLLGRHARQWLGDLGRFLVGKWSGEDKPYHYQFFRGWLDYLRVLPVPEALFPSLAREPEARLLRRLEIVYDMHYHPFEFDEFTEGPNRALKGDETEGEVYGPAEILPPLLESPYVTNLRVFKLGFSDSEDQIGYSTMVHPFGDCNVQQVIDFLEKCPRLEELYLNTDLRDIDRLFTLPALGNLRVFQYYYGSNYYPGDDRQGHAYPLSVLANNASLKRLTTLRLHPGRDATIDIDELDALLRSPHLPALTHLQVHMTTFGDEGCRRILDSGILKRLEVLDLGYGNMTDEGARLLAGCPDLKNLRLLDVRRNALTAEGIATLEGVGIKVVADNQHSGDEEYPDYLYEVDFE